MSRVLVAVALLLVLPIAACGDDEPSSPDPPPVVDDLPEPCLLLDSEEAGDVLGGPVEARPQDSEANPVVGASRSCSYLPVGADELTSPDLVLVVTPGEADGDLGASRSLATVGYDGATTHDVEVDGATEAFALVSGDEDFPATTVFVGVPDLVVSLTAFGDDAERLALAAAPVAVAGLPG